VQRVLAPRVLELEGALATANRQVLAYCTARGRDVSSCFEQGVDFHAPALLALARVLTHQALVLTGASAALSLILAPQIGDQVASQQLVRLLEDLALCAEQSARLLDEHTTLIMLMAHLPFSQASVPGTGAAASGLGYQSRVRSAVALLRRAEAWLKTVDHETGAHATLPGFAPDALSLESALAMP
jgi:hypothetical protein